MAGEREAKTSESAKAKDAAETERATAVAPKRPDSPYRASDEPHAVDLHDEEPSALREYAKFIVPIAVLAAAGIAGFVQGPPATLLVLCASALATAIWLFWESVRTLVGETPLSGADAYALGAPRAEEEQKRAVLRALKDLEFEHNVGKINDDEYRAQTARYRAEAKRLLRRLEEEAENNPRKARVQAIVAKRLAAEGLSTTSWQPEVNRKRENERRKQSGEPNREPVAEPRQAEPEAEEEEARKSACAECGTLNDSDAMFCKKCGTRQPRRGAEGEPTKSGPDDKREENV